jgi:hypothetical protein
MGRMGHSTTRAALIYQHRTAERDRLIASVMSELVEAELDEMACHRARSGTRATGRIRRPHRTDLPFITSILRQDPCLWERGSP